MPILKYKEIRMIDDSTHFHESIDWSDRFARRIEQQTLLRMTQWLNEQGTEGEALAIKAYALFIKE